MDVTQMGGKLVEDSICIVRVPFDFLVEWARKTDLKQSCTQVADDEGGRHGGVASLQEVDGVQEQEVTRDDEDGQDSGWFWVHIWINAERKEFVHKCVQVYYTDRR